MPLFETDETLEQLLYTPSQAEVLQPDLYAPQPQILPSPSPLQEYMLIIIPLGDEDYQTSRLVHPLFVLFVVSLSMLVLGRVFRKPSTRNMSSQSTAIENDVEQKREGVVERVGNLIGDKVGDGDKDDRGNMQHMLHV